MSKMIHVHVMPSLCVFIVVWTVQVHTLGLHALQKRSQSLCTFLRGAVKLNVRVSAGGALATFPERPFHLERRSCATNQFGQYGTERAGCFPKILMKFL